MRKAAILSLLLLSLCGTAWAQATWDGSFSTSWDDAENWDTFPSLPADGVAIIIDNGTNQPTFSGTHSYASLTINNGATLTLSGVMTVTGNVTGAGTLAGGTGTLEVAGAFTPSNFNRGTGTVVFNGSAAQSTGAYTFYDLEIDSSDTVTSTGTVNVDGNLTVTNGNYTVGGTNNTTFTVSGTVTNGGTLTLRASTANRDTAVDFGSTVENTGTLALSASANNADLTVNITGDLTNSGTLTLAASNATSTTTLAMGGGTDIDNTGGSLGVTSSTGTVTLSSSGTTTLVSGSNALSLSDTTLRLDGFASEVAQTLDGSDAFILTGTASFSAGLTVNCSVAGTTYLQVQGNTLNATGGLTITRGTVTVGAGTIYTDTAALSLAANGRLQSTGASTLDVGSVSNLGTITVQTASPSSWTVDGDFTSSGTVTLTTAPTTWSVGGNFTSSGTITNTASNTISVGGDLSISGTFNTPANSTIVMTAASSADLTATGMTLGDIEINSGGTVTLLSGLTLYDDLTLTAGTLAAAGNAVTAGGDITFDEGLITSSGTVSVAGAFARTGAGYLTSSGTGTLVFNGTTGNQAFNPAGSTFVNVTVNKTAGAVRTVTPSAPLSLSGNLTMTAGTLAAAGNAVDIGGNLAVAAGIVTSSGTVSVAGNWTRTGAGYLTSSGSGTVVFDGSADQSFVPTGSTFVNLTVDNDGAAGANRVTPSAGFTVTGNLTATEGIFAAGGNTIVVTGDLALNTGGVTSSGIVRVAGAFARTAPGYFSSTGTLEFNGTGAQAFNPAGSTFSAVSVTNSGGTVTASGSFECATYAQSVDGGTFQLSGGYTMTVTTSASVTDGALDLVGAYSGSGATFSVGSAAGGTVTVGTSAFETGAMTVSNSGIFRQTGDNGANANTVASLSVSGGECSWDYGVAGGTLTISGSCGQTGGTLAFNLKNVTWGNDPTGAFSFYDLVIPNSVTMEPAAGATITVRRSISIESGGSYSAANGPTIIWGGAGTVGVAGGTFSDVDEASNMGTVIIRGDYGKSLSTAMNTGALTIDDVDDATDQSLTLNNHNLTTTGAITGYGTLVAGSATIYAGGSMTVAGFTQGTSTVIFNADANVGCAGYTFYALQMNLGTSARTLTPSGGITVTNGFTQTRGTFVGGTALEHTIAGAWDSSSADVGFTRGTSTIRMSSASPGITTDAETFYELILNYGGSLGSNITVEAGFRAAASGSGTLALNTRTLTVGAGLNLTNATVTFTAGSSAIVLSGGNQTFSTNNQTFYDVTLSAQASANTVTVSGNLIVSHDLSVGAYRNLSFADNDGTLSVSGAATNAGTITLSDDAVAATTTATFSNLLTNTGGTLTGGSGTVYLNGGISGGSFTGTTSTAYVGGVFTPSFTHNSGTIRFNGSAAQGFGAYTFNNLTIDNSNGVTTSGNTIAQGNLWCRAGTFTVDGYSLSVAGNVTQNGGGIHSTTTVYLTGTTASLTVDFSTSTLAALSVTRTAGTATTSAGFSCSSYSQSGTGGTFAVDNGDTMTVTGNVTVTNGTLSLVNGSVLAVGGNLTLGTLSAGATSLVRFNGGVSQSVWPNGQTFGDIEATNSSTVRWSGSAITYDIEIDAGSVFRLDSTVLPVGDVTLTVVDTHAIANSGTFDLDSASGALTLQGSAANASFTGTDITWGGDDLTMGLFVYAPAATLPSGTILYLNAAASFTTGLTVSSGAELDCNTHTLSCGAFTSAGTIDASDAHTISASGNVVIGGAISGTSTNSTLEMTGASTTLTASIALGNFIANASASTSATPVALASNCEFDGDVTISSGYFSAGTYAITANADWINGTGVGARFLPGTGTVTFTAAAVRIEGPNQWYNLTYEIEGGVIRFDTNTLQYFLAGGTFRVFSTSATATDWITLTRDDSIYADGTDLDWTPPSQPDLTYMWSLELGAGAALDFQYVNVWYNDARDSPISYDSDVITLGLATIGVVPPERSDTCFMWISSLNAIYSYTEDSDDDGRIDRIRVTTQAALNMDFSDFAVAVAGYDIDTSQGVNGYTGTYGETDFYVHLVEKKYLDGSRTPSWTITRNTSLTGFGPEFFTVKTLFTPMYPADMVPPRIAYTLTVPETAETFFAFNEPVVGVAGGIPGATVSVAGLLGDGDVYGVVADYGAGNERDRAYILAETLLSVDAGITDDALTTATANGFTDLADDTYYSFFISTHPTSPAGDASNTIVDTDHRVSDLLISVEPSTTAGAWSQANPDSYFVWPLWAKDGAYYPLDPATEYTDYTAEEASGQYVGFIRGFDGEGFLRDQDFDLQAADGLSLGSTPILVYKSNVADAYLSEVPGIWLPTYLDTDFSGLAAAPFAGFSTKTATGGSGIWDYDFLASDAEVFDNATLDFYFRIPGYNTNLYAGRLDMDTDATTLPADWYLRVRPFTFEIHNVITQRGGVSILNNVIDPTTGETVRLHYTITKTGPVTITVFTLDGDVVRSLQRGSMGPGDYTASWDGRNRSGDAVARGMYFIRIVAAGIDEIRKVMVVRY